jgi:hypothetical protein
MGNSGFGAGWRAKKKLVAQIQQMRKKADPRSMGFGQSRRADFDRLKLVVTSRMRRALVDCGAAIR